MSFPVDTFPISANLLPMSETTMPRLAGQGASELGKQHSLYYRVTINYGIRPSSCFKVAAQDARQVEDSLETLCPFYARHKKDAISIRIDDWNQFSAVLTRNVL